MSDGLVVVGDALLDRDVQGHAERLSPDAPVPVLDEAGSELRPGGAGLAAALAARDGHPVTLVTALARDTAAAELRAALDRAGVEVVDVGLDGATPEKVRFRSGDRSLMRLDRGGSEGAVGPATAAARAAIGWASSVLVSDYGRGVAAEPGVREALSGLEPDVPVIWDPHPLGVDPIPAVTVVTPNEAEVARAEPEPAGPGLAELAERAGRLRARWEARSLCTTRGAGGALLLRGDRPPLAVPAPSVAGGDPCGAGDRFSSRLAVALGAGASVEDGVVDAVVCASAFVAAGGAARGLADRDGLVPGEEGLDVVERVRANGGTVVATGGCFDLLHAGHVRTLEAARRLGDCLVVCLNSDASVRLLKGADRPLVPEADRAAVLSALACVDAVVIFDDETPAGVLERIRPHVWAKGGDYDGVELPEEAVLRRWGGRAVILPFVEGRSTTRLIEEAAGRV